MVLTDIRDELGQRTAKEISEAGGEAIYLHLDVTSEAEWVSVVEAAVSRFGRLDILVNNAGSGARYRVEDTSEEDWDGQMNVHAKGVFLGDQARHSPTAKGGRRLNHQRFFNLWTRGQRDFHCVPCRQGSHSPVQQVGGNPIRQRKHPGEFGASWVRAYTSHRPGISRPGLLRKYQVADTDGSGGERLRHCLWNAVPGI